MPPSRRDFIASAATGAAGLSLAALTGLAQGAGRAPGPRPVAISSANGLRSVARAVELIRAGGDPLDAVIAGVNIVEDDPDDTSVGYGGLPNEQGVVELDASVMHGPLHKAGAVAALQNVRYPSKVAQLVMQRSDHVLLVGAGALQFARAHGFAEENLLTDKARRIWLQWRETHSDRDDWLPPTTAPASGPGAKAVEPQPGELYPEVRNPPTGTIHCSAVTAAGDLAGVTTTSGLAFKIPGRVGDSPIIGAGLYVDNGAGAAGSTGRGEANLQNLSSFMVVENMRRGMTAQEACLDVLRRVATTTEPRLRNGKGEPDYDLRLYAVRKDGGVGGASLRGAGQMAVCDGGEPRLIDIPGLYG